MKKILLSIASLLVAVSLSAAVYVAGNGKSDANGSFCCGVNWDTSACEMTGGSITFLNVAPETYEFKIVDNGTWLGASIYKGEIVPGIVMTGDNMKFTISTASDITITYDADSKTVTSLTSTNGFGELVIAVYTVVGSKTLCGGEDDFDTSLTENDMTLDGNVWKKVYTNVAQGEYEYKVVGNHSWAAYEFPGSGTNQIGIVDVDNSTVTITFNPALDDDAEDKLTFVVGGQSNVNDVNADAGLRVANGTVYCPADFKIYNQMGIDVTALNGNLSGIYIVKYDGKAISVFVK